MFTGSMSHRILWIALAVVAIAAVFAAVVLVARAPNYSTVTFPTTAPAVTVPTTVMPSLEPCTASAGFSCSDVIFHSGVLSMGFGQSTGSNWTSATLQFVPYGENYTPGFLIATLPDGLATGRSTTFALSIPGSIANASAGTALRGSLYANYTTAAGMAVAVAASINVTAT